VETIESEGEDEVSTQSEHDRNTFTTSAVITNNRPADSTLTNRVEINHTSLPPQVNIYTNLKIHICLYIIYI
jgi:hypothetical protein